MKDRIDKCLKLIFPFKKINFFVVTLFFLGLIIGAIFSATISINDRNLVVEKITLFLSNIDENLINTISSFKNSLLINFTYLFLILILGMTLIGIVLSVMLLFLKGFTFGFTLASFIISYNYKGILLSILYLLFGQFLNIIVILIAAIYSITFCYKILLVIFKNKNIEFKRFIKSYLFISIILIIISIISSFFETYLFPSFIKFIINLYV